MKIYAYLLLTLLYHTNPLWATDSKHNFKVTVHGQGQPMLLIPGLSNDATVWDSTVAKYQAQYEMHTITLPGFAGQPALADKNNFLFQVRDQLLAYINTQEWKKPVIVGHSLGGYMALLMAIEQPTLFDKIVIVDAVPFIPALTMPGATEATSKPMADGMKIQMSSQSDEIRAASLDMILATMITDPEKIKIAKQWGMDSDSETVSQAMYEMMTHDIRQEIAIIKSPTLVMGAWIAYKAYGMSHERLEQSYGAQYQQLTGHQLAITDTGKHFIMWDDPEFYFATMDAFLQQ